MKVIGEDLGINFFLICELDLNRPLLSKSRGPSQLCSFRGQSFTCMLSLFLEHLFNPHSPFHTHTVRHALWSAVYRTCWINGQWGLMGINNVPLILKGVSHLIQIVTSLVPFTVWKYHQLSYLSLREGWWYFQTVVPLETIFGRSLLF